MTLRGLVSHYAQATGDQAGDLPRDATAVSLGATYALNDRVSLWGTASYLDGIIDSDEDNFYLSEVSLGVDYAVAAVPGLTAFGAVTYFDAFQAGENDYAYVTQINLGLRYAFGGPDTPERGKRAPLPNIENWAAIGTGVVE